MLPPDYAKKRAVSQSALKKWVEHKTAMDAMPTSPKTIFGLGDLFEGMVGNAPWSDKYGFCTAANRCPDEVYAAIENGSWPDLSAMYVFNKNGERNATYKNRHACLDWYGRNLRYPVSLDDFRGIVRLAVSARKVRPFEKLNFAEQTRRIPFSEIVPQCRQQVPLYWEMEGVAKKGLVDFLWEAPGLTILFDTKWTGNKASFLSGLRSSGYLQALHYCEGATAIYGGQSIFIWIVGVHSEPFEAFAVTLDMNNHGLIYQNYLDLCAEYAEWDRKGRKRRGFGEAKEIRVYN